jgi:hypothetical protein
MSQEPYKDRTAAILDAITALILLLWAVSVVLLS